MNSAAECVLDKSTEGEIIFLFSAKKEWQAQGKKNPARRAHGIFHHLGGW